MKSVVGTSAKNDKFWGLTVVVQFEMTVENLTPAKYVISSRVFRRRALGSICTRFLRVNGQSAGVAARDLVLLSTELSVGKHKVLQGYSPALPIHAKSGPERGPKARARSRPSG